MNDATSAPEVDPVVRCRGLTKVFKDFWLRPRVTAVDGLDLDVRRGEIFGLLGPNGSGKSTVIKLILGLLFPTGGDIRIFGEPPTSVAVKSRIGYLPEDSQLYPFLNAREILDYYGRLLHIERPIRRARSAELIEMVGLRGAEERPVGEYSKGMQRRIGLAQALINDPDLLILDEPTNGLDPIGTRQVKDLVLELKQRQKTVLITSHLLADVEDVCSRVAILYGGRIRQQGTIDELLTRSDRSIVTTDPLPPPTVERLTGMLAEEGHRVHGVEAPRQSLESLFLEIVEEARVGGAKTSGALDGSSTAEFLRAPDRPQDGAARKDRR